MNFSKFIENKDTSYGYITEASFSRGKLEKVALQYGKILGKTLGGEFKVLDVETFKGDLGSGKGVRTMNNAGHQIRFNYDEALAKMGQGSKYYLTSITYWNPSNKDFESPDMTVVFHPQANVLDILSKVAETIKSGRIQENFMNESPTKKEIKAWLQDKGIHPSYSADSKKEFLHKALVKKGLTEEFAIFAGSKEKNSFSDEIKKEEKDFEKVYADPDLVFEDIEQLTKLIALGEWKSLIVCGMGGIGKTYHIADETGGMLPKILGPVGNKWTYHSGTKAAPFSFYKTTFSERDKIIVWDEADSLLKNKDIIMMLKPGLDTSGDNTFEYMSGTKNMVGLSKQEIIDYGNFVDEEIDNGAEITMGKEKSGQVKLPSKFYFTGGMIFISNMKSSEIEQAIMSRSIFVDVHLAAQDVEKRIRTIMRAKAAGSPDVTEEDVDEIMEALGSAAPQTGKVQYMTPEYARKSKQLTVRAASLALKMKKAGLKNWKRLAALYA